MRGRPQSGQVIVLVAFALLALIGTAALVLLAGSVEWQRNQLQQLADQAALDSAMKIGVGCSAGSATTVITEADNFIATQRSRTGTLNVAAGTCATPYTGTDTFAGGLSETIHYPYRAHQQQVEVILTLTLPISFGTQLGQTTTTVIRRAVGEQLAGSTIALSANTLNCSGGQVNIAGSVMSQSAILLTGGCVLYAHSRLDASGSYSDLGNVSVYAPSQSWSGIGGSCTGTVTNAICSDGFEVSGHVPVSVACGTTGSNAYFSAGDAAVNPNPCAAGKAPQPPPPVSTALPPEPNADPLIDATLPGGVACTSGGSYASIVVNGVTVGTGNAGAPTKDASGFYHFKSGCYGYLNPGALTSGGSIANVQSGPEVVTGSGNVTATLPVASTAGDLLLATVVGGNNVSPFSGPAGWTRATSVGQSGDGEVEIWYLANSSVPVTSAAFTSGSSTSIAQLSEWRGVATVAALDRTGTATSSSNVTASTVSTSAADTAAGDLGITVTTWTSGTFSSGAGWSTMYHDNGIATASDYQLGLPAAVASETMTSSSSTLWANAIATFKPGGSAAGAVLDPGFYYFNGSGLGGGGGICLNGSTLLARDVTLEFVNQAGFSSGTCAVGGGASCTGACQFGSTPCSLSTCPPNAGADSPNNLTWFAAPCSTAPNLDSASCTGSAWCPAGDRACWNLLIWTPASATGQLTINGTAARHWLLGSIFWPGTCTDTVNGTSSVAGTLECGSLSISAAAGAGTAVGGDYGVSTALVEAVLVE
ncbi:MAG: pilus assembly protein TadG-related protein [Candidatus Dormiibacterota bacterium]